MITVHEIQRPLSPAGARVLAQRLAAEHIDLLIETGPVVHLTALLPLTTAQEAHALHAVCGVTDARVVVHAELPAVVPECLLCKSTGVDLEHELCGVCTGRLARHGAVT